MNDDINGTYRTSNGETERRCPECDRWTRAEWIDNGVGLQQCGPYCCESCGWIEQRPSIENLFR